MAAICVAAAAGLLVLGYIVMLRIDRCVARGDLRPEAERPEMEERPAQEARPPRERLGWIRRRAAVRSWSATRILSVGFAAIIVFGGVALTLPISNRSGQSLGFLDALFTSASATCVTGLVRFDTFTQFSLFGQAVILLLIQTGGLGFMTVAILFSLALGRRIGLRERSLLAESVGSMQIGGIVRMVRRILIGTAAIELLGAAVLATRLVPMFGPARGIWFSVFHSVSAFCNAGFDLMGAVSPDSSLSLFAYDPVVSLTIMALITVGGIGFVVWNDLLECRFRLRELRLHSKAALAFSAALILGGTALFLLVEGDGAFAGMSFGQALLCASFQSVTPRTAGYFTVPQAALTDGGLLLTILLMAIGASPGGTGGGIKTTTVIAAASAILSSVRGREDAAVGRYRLEDEAVRRAFCSAAVYLAMAVFGLGVLCVQGVPMAEAAFECFSAIGTVGLSTGVTPTLRPLSQLVIISLMYAGRLGSLTVFIAVTRSHGVSKLRSPVGKLIIG